MGLNFLSIISVDKKNVKVRIFSLAIGNKISDQRIINPVYNIAQSQINKGFRNDKYIDNQYLVAKKS